MADKTRFFSVATEGATTDGRVIERAWIEQMAKNYDPAKYTARVNMEHYRGLSADGPFKAYGDVTAVKTQEVGGKLVLLAQIAPTPDLIAYNRAKQKVFTSIEVNPAFADTGEAYLVGLAVTDSPASLGTDYLQFCATAGDKSPLAPRKHTPTNLFTAGAETKIELEAAAAEDTVSAFFSKLGEKLFGSTSASTAAAAATQERAAPAPAAPGGGASASGEFARLEQAMTGAFTKLGEGIEAARRADDVRFTKLQGDFDAFVRKVDGADASTMHRPASAGAHSTKHQPVDF